MNIDKLVQLISQSVTFGATDISILHPITGMLCDEGYYVSDPLSEARFRSVPTLGSILGWVNGPFLTSAHERDGPHSRDHTGSQGYGRLIDDDSRVGIWITGNRYFLTREHACKDLVEATGLAKDLRSGHVLIVGPTGDVVMKAPHYGDYRAYPGIERCTFHT